MNDSTLKITADSENYQTFGDSLSSFQLVKTVNSSRFNVTSFDHMTVDKRITIMFEYSEIDERKIISQVQYRVNIKGIILLRNVCRLQTQEILRGISTVARF